jgi:light-regulated signal transduction histidine kinase (bacteriophytochrome)
LKLTAFSCERKIEDYRWPRTNHVSYAVKDEARTIGKLFAYNESIILLQNIRRHVFTSIFHSNCIERDLQSIEPPYKFSVISGILIIPLALSGSDFLVFVRKGKLREVSWAGNPNEKVMRPGTGYLEPRSSFARWSESVVGTSREWTEDEGRLLFRKPST